MNIRTLKRVQCEKVKVKYAHIYWTYRINYNIVWCKTASKSKQ